jgi:hypothetical protein
LSAIRITIHSTGGGLCSLSAKESDGLTVTFDDGTVKEAFLSWKSFRQLLALKSSQAVKPEPRVPAPQPATLPVAGASK